MKFHVPGTYGCFLEMPQKSSVGYPLTTTGVFRTVSKTSAAAQDVVAGSDSFPILLSMQRLPESNMERDCKFCKSTVMFSSVTVTCSKITAKTSVLPRGNSQREAKKTWQA